MTTAELTILLIILAIAINLPFGAYRATVRRLSWKWFAAIHLPIPFIFLLRVSFGFSAWYIPLMLACAVAGQLLGSWLYGLWRGRRALAQPDAAE